MSLINFFSSLHPVQTCPLVQNSIIKDRLGQVLDRFINNILSKFSLKTYLTGQVGQVGQVISSLKNNARHYLAKQKDNSNHETI